MHTEFFYHLPSVPILYFLLLQPHQTVWHFLSFGEVFSCLCVYLYYPIWLPSHLIHLASFHLFVKCQFKIKIFFEFSPDFSRYIQDHRSPVVSVSAWNRLECLQESPKVKMRIVLLITSFSKGMVDMEWFCMVNELPNWHTHFCILP